MEIHSPVQILPRVESIQYNHSNDDHSVTELVSQIQPGWEMDLHSLQNHKIRLLLHQ